MKQRIASIIFTVLCILNLLACSNNTSVTKNIQPQLSTNNTVANTEQQTQIATRVVALTSLSADLVYNLDKNKLVAVPSRGYTAKEAKFQEFAKIGDRTGVNLEKIIAQKPDLVIGSDTFQAAALKRLKELGIATISHNTSSWADLENLTQTVGDRIGIDPQPILNKFQSFLGNIDNDNSVIVLVSTKPILSPNRDSWAGDLLNKFKYKNLAAELQSNSQLRGYINLSPEKILTANPNKIFLIKSDEIATEEITKQPFWKELKAVKANQVYTLPYEGLISPTSIDSVAEVCNKLREIASK